MLELKQSQFLLHNPELPYIKENKKLRQLKEKGEEDGGEVKNPYQRDARITSVKVQALGCGMGEENPLCLLAAYFNFVITKRVKSP